MSTDVPVDLDLVRRYNQPGPRYTSYPTAPHFHENYGPATFADDLTAASADTPLSLYLHLPFCRSLCYYCGCHMTVTRDREQIEKYLTALKQEVDLFARRIDLDRPVVQIHWGGGTPSYLTAEQIRDLGDHLHDRFSIASDAEISLEADPRTLSKERLAAAGSVGFNRLSVGVQDVNRKVQEAINRFQSLDQIEQIVEWSRRFDFNGINFDLVYGLPHQTRDRFERTLGATTRLAPDRIALYSYAHVPSIKKHQRAIDEEALPAPEDKLRLFQRGLERLRTCLVDGYDDRDTVGEAAKWRPNAPGSLVSRSGTTRQMQKPFCTRSTKSQAVDSPPNRFPTLNT